MSRLIAIDPGSSKCGLVLVNTQSLIVLDGRIENSQSVVPLVSSWKKASPSSEILLGNGTTSEVWLNRLTSIAPVKLVEERGTTLKARKRYWELWPPAIWSRWLPNGLLIPPQDVDAVAALVILEDYLGKKFFWPGSPSFKTEP